MQELRSIPTSGAPPRRGGRLPPSMLAQRKLSGWKTATRFSEVVPPVLHPPPWAQLSPARCGAHRLLRKSSYAGATLWGQRICVLWGQDINVANDGSG